MTRGWDAGRAPERVIGHFGRWAALAIVVGVLAGCASGSRGRGPMVLAPSPVVAPSPLAPRAAPPQLPTTPPTPTLADLPGWSLEDHAAALRAFADACRRVANPTLADVCGQAIALGPADEPDARAFLERAFRAEPIVAEGLLTGYFAPSYPARRRRGGDFTAPVRPRPPDLPRHWPAGAASYPERARIEKRPAADALAWMRPEDLFFLQMQGSGALMFDDGDRLLAVSDGANGARFVGIAGPMQALGLLSQAHASGEAVHDWLARHRGAAAAAAMDLDPRYVFFRLRPDTGGEPAGAAGVPLIPGRAVAIDPAAHAYGELLWIEATDPSLAAARPDYRRLVVALDTGGAIRGAARADLYLGRGDAAGEEAGRVRHRLRMWRLRPTQLQVRQASADP